MWRGRAGYPRTIFFQIEVHRAAAAVCRSCGAHKPYLIPRNQPAKGDRDGESRGYLETHAHGVVADLPVCTAKSVILMVSTCKSPMCAV